MNALTILGQNAVIAAPQLLGWEISCHSPDGLTGGKIVEVEAYLGKRDPASHAFRGQIPRNAPMFGGAGSIYIYRSYGIHLCLNLVTGPIGSAEAVLIRALEPTLGLNLMAARRRQTNVHLLTSGPGRVGQALGLSLELTGKQLGETTITLTAPSTPIDPAAIMATPRLGISAAKDAPWRFYITGNQFVSRP